jgi:hypothetical protein
MIIEKEYFKNKFIAYKMTLENGQFWAVPLDSSNKDYQTIQKWIAEGGEVIDNPPTE